MKQTLKRLACTLLILAMFTSIIPLKAFAWGYDSHISSANTLFYEMCQSDEDVMDSGAVHTEVTVYAPYDDHSEAGTFTYAVPDEFWHAIYYHRDAFYAGAMGPDFYPDILIGQGYIHPLDPNVGAGDWLVLLCESVNKLPKDSEERDEALAFTLGYMLHYCGDIFGHDFVNTFSGGTFPSVLPMLQGDIDLTDVNNILSHMSTESYMDDLVTKKFGVAPKAPTRFIADTMYVNGSIACGPAEIFEGYESIPIHLETLLDLRQDIMDIADEYRASTELFTMAISSGFDQWAQDIDRAIYALADTFDRIAMRMATGLPNEKITEKEREEWFWDGPPFSEYMKGALDFDITDGSTVTIIKEELNLWLDEYGAYCFFVPDWMIDGLPEALSHLLWPVELAVTAIKNAIKEIFSEILASSVESMINMDELKVLVEMIDDRLDNPEVQLDHPDNPYKPSQDNFGELKKYMDRFAAEQALLDGQTEESLKTGQDGGVMAQLADSDFEAFYNTMVLFKLILMGPENFTDFIEKTTGIRQGEYRMNEGHLTATVVRLDVTTYDTEFAGTDDNVYVTVFKLGDGGTRTEVARKLLDNSLSNDLEAGHTDSFYVGLSEPVEVDKLEFLLHQQGTATAFGDWMCENVNITPMHAGIELTEPIGVGGNLYMDDGVIWELDFQSALKRRNGKIDASTPITNVKVQIKTKDGSYLNGTDFRVYLNAWDITDGEWKEKVDLDKYLYNDFEAGDNDTYHVPLAKYDPESQTTIGPRLGDLVLGIEHTADYEWVIDEIVVTPYYGTLQLTNPITFPGKTLKEETYALDLGAVLTANYTFKQYDPLEITYETCLDAGLLENIKSLDDGVQWENLPVLWRDKQGRKLFYDLFKGFRPEMELSMPDTVNAHEPVDIIVRFNPMWNGVPSERRNQVSGIPDMPAVSGAVELTIISPSGQEYTISAKVDNGVASIREFYLGSAMFAGKTIEVGYYDIRITYSDNEDMNYAGYTKTINDVFVVPLEFENTEGETKKIVQAGTQSDDGGYVQGGGILFEGESAMLEAIPKKGYRFVRWTKDGQTVSTDRIYRFKVTDDGNYVAEFEPETYIVIANPADEHGTTAVYGSQKHGERTTVCAETNEGYRFRGWIDESGREVSSSASYSFVTESNRNLTAVFEKVHAISLPTGNGYTVTGVEERAKAAWEITTPQVTDGGSYSFTLRIDEGYIKSESFAVKANGRMLTETDGKYTVSDITTDQQITVEGVEEAVPTPNPTILYRHTEDRVIITVIGEGDVTLYVDRRAVSNHYVIERGAEDREYSVYATAKAKDKLISGNAVIENGKIVGGTNELEILLVTGLDHTVIVPCDHGQLRHVPAVPADSHNAGCKAYYFCEQCGAIFADEAARREIDDLTAWKNGAGKLPSHSFYLWLGIGVAVVAVALGVLLALHLLKKKEARKPDPDAHNNL